MVRRAVIGALVATTVVATATTAAAEPYTNRFRGDGSSSFGFAWDYARWNARDKAVADGFTDPATQCEEVFAFGNVFDAMVIWECTRQV